MPEQPNRLKIGRATASWGPRPYGRNQIIINADVDATDDLVAVAHAVRDAITGISPQGLTDEIRA